METDAIVKKSGVMLSEICAKRLHELLCWAKDEQNGGIKDLFVEDAADEICRWHAGMDREEARELACIIWDWQAAQGDED